MSSPAHARRTQRGGAHRPWVFINMAMTADGKIATANREVSSFGSAADKEHLLALRATADAVMAGARTVDSNQVNMGPGPERFRAQRLRRGLEEYNLRVVVTRSGSLNPQAHIFTRRFSPILVLTTGRAPEQRLAALREAADHVRICGEKEIDWAETLAWLRHEWRVRRLLCEGGGELNDALFRAGVVDELNLTICPYLFGGRDAPTIVDGQGVDSLDRAAQMRLHRFRKLKDEVFLVYRSRKARSGPRDVCPR